MTYEQIQDWVEENFIASEYNSPIEYLQAVKDTFVTDGMKFPNQAEQYILELYNQTYSERDNTIYQQIEKRREKDQLVADMFGSGQVQQSLSDEIIESYERPEIMDIDMTTLPTYKEDVTPPKIKRFERKEKFTSRAKGFFRRLFGR